MADNFTGNPGTGGDTFSADDIGGVKVQRVKLMLGADGVNGGDASSSNPMPVTGPVTDAQLRASAVPVSMSAAASQVVDTNNTATIVAPGSAFVGTWTATRSANYVRQLTVLASTVSSGLGGTFVFEYGENGSTATISETRVITDFATVRDFDLINAGAYFRVSFTPSRAMTGAEMVFVTTTHRRLNDGAFVRLANQEIEEANAAMPQTFSYGKAFGLDGKSKNLRASDVSASNNSEANLAGAGVFTGTGENCVQFQSISVFVGSNASGSFTIEFAKNLTDFGTANLAASIPRTYTGGAGQTYVFVPVAQWVRIVYTNGGTAQTAFRLQTVFHATALGPIFAPLNTSLSDVALAQNARSVIAGKNPAGSYLNVPTNTIGNLIVADFLTEVRRGNVAGHSMVSGAGYNPDIDAAASETIWGAGGTYAFPAAAATISVVSTSALDTSAGTGARTLTIEGLNSSYAAISETITLNGVVPVVTTASFLRVNRAYTATAGSGGSNAGTITGITVSTSLTMFGMVPAANTSQLGLYTVPAGYTAYLVQINLTGALATASAILQGQLWGRAFGGLFLIQDNYSCGTTSSGTIVTYIAPLVFTEKSDLYFQGIASTNNTVASIRFDMMLIASGS